MISLQTLCERDNYRCYLCGGPVMKNAPEGHPRAPTRDHVVPRAKGGPNHNQNLRLAHYRCNQERATRPPEKFIKVKQKKSPWKTEMERRRKARELIFNKIRGVT